MTDDLPTRHTHRFVVEPPGTTEPSEQATRCSPMSEMTHVVGVWPASRCGRDLLDPDIGPGRVVFPRWVHEWDVDYSPDWVVWCPACRAARVG